MTPGPEEWGAVVEPEGPQAWGAAPTAGPQSWGAVPAEEPKSWWERGQVKPTALTMDPAVRTGPYVEHVLKAFGHGFAEGFGPERLGVSPESEKALQGWGIFRSGEGDRFNPLKAMNEVLAQVVVGTPELALRVGGGLLRAGQAAAVEAGLPRDIAALPEAFFGMPHPLGIPQGFPTVKVRAESVTETRGAPGPSFTAEAGGIQAFHGSPHDFTAFDLSKIGTGEGAQSYGHGLYVAENKGVAETYQHSIVHTEFSPPEAVAKTHLEMFSENRTAAIKHLDEVLAADRFKGAKERADYQGARDLLAGGWEPPKGNLYQVRINTNKEHFLDWDKPLSEQPENVQKFLIAHGADPGIKSFHGEQFMRQLADELGGQEAASAALREAGIPGIKYLDQGSREGGAGSHNFVLFDDSLVEITHKNGEPLPDVAQARDLGVIGPERPSINEGAPKEAAAMAAEQKRPETLKSEPLDSWQQRFEHFVTKLDTAHDVKQLIRDAARANNDFLPARQGDIPLQHVEAVAQAAGVEPSEINTRGLGRTLRNDAEVRVAMQAMLQLTDNVKTAARDVKADGSPESLIKLQEAIMRRDLAVEQVVGLRAEWGRTGNVLQEFMRDVKDQDALNTFLKDKGRTPSDLHEIARAIDELDRTGAAKVLSDARTNPPGWFYWTWVQGLISGLLTHTKYFAANGLYAGIERGVTTPIASIIGKLKETAGSQAERVYFGEMAASMYGMFAAVPNAAIVTAKSIKAGLRAPLESEIALRDAAIARGEKVPKFLEMAVNPLTLQGRPTGKFMRIPFTDIGFAEDGAVTRIAGRVLGAPGDAAMGIHTFFKVMGERAGIEQGAYHTAAKEGLIPTDAQFWTRRAEIAANPGDAILKDAVEGAYKGTFMQELGPRAKRWQAAAKNDPIGKWVFPFLHIPVNIVKSVYEHTPLALLDKDMRADILGQNGGVKQDMAIARMVVGSSIMGYFVNAALNGRATGDYPRDPKERDKWKLEGKQPNSILIADHWVSFNRFGPAGSLANLGANIGYVIPHLTSDDDEAMTRATWHGVNAAARVIMDEAGFLSLAMIFEAVHDEKKGTAWVASQASSLVPFSSFVSQTASGGLPFTGGAGGDPYMREAKTFIDGIKYRIPFARETLLPKRDWSGQPIDNPQYGNILRQRQVNTDPVDLEMARLGIHPAPPQDRIGGVKLPPTMYDRYQTVAGAFTRTVLENMVAQPGWSDLPAFVREDIFRKTIAATRQGAAATMQARYPQIIQQGVQNRLDHINGVKPTKLKEAGE